MSPFIEYIIPSIIIVISNVFGGDYRSRKYEIVTAIFGWLGAISLTLYFILLLIRSFLAPNFKYDIEHYIVHITWFTLLAAFSRDWEKLLKQIFRNKQ